MRANILIIPLFTILLFPGGMFAQNFSVVDPGFGICENPAAAWADIDNDGDLDAFFSGKNDLGTAESHLYRNDGGGSFVEISTGISGVTYAACAFEDMNNDGFVDLAILGFNGSSAISSIYRNDGSGNFTDIGATLSGLSYGGIAWADYDNDGLSDLLISGKDDAGTAFTILYHNDGDEVFSNSNAGLDGLMYSSLAWNDFDLDGDMDFAISGEDDSEQAQCIIYINNDGNFTDMGAGLIGYSQASLAWGDYNNDTYADLLVSGNSNVPGTDTEVYKNNGGSSFSALSGTYYGVSSGSSIWGDFNDDGSLDFIVAGSQSVGGSPPPPPSATPLIYLYLNQGGDVFSENQITLAAPHVNAVVCGDYDNDSDLDLLVSGGFANPINGTENFTRLFRNDVTSTNNPPSPPTALSYVQTGDELIISWDASTDDKTPASGLNYNLRLGSQQNNVDVFSPNADLSTGYRKIVATGNTSGNLDWGIFGIGFGDYYASVQAIDHNYAGSSFSADLLISISPTASFSMVDSLCILEETMITYTGNASPSAQYVWDFGGGTITSGTGQGPYQIYWDTEGVKTVSLTVIENGATSDPFSKNVEVAGFAPQPGAITGDTELCQGTLSGEYFIVPLPDVTTYEWELSPPAAGSVTGNSVVGTVVWDPGFSGIAYLNVKATNACGTGPASNNLEIVLLALPGEAAKPEGPEELCLNSGNTTYTTMGVPNALAFSWGISPETAGNIINSGLEAEVDWDDAFTGSAYIYVIASNACGQGPSSDSILVSVLVPPVAYAGEDQVISYGNSTQLSGSASGGSGSYTYYWTPEEVIVDNTVADPFTHTLFQSVQFVLTVTDEVSGCSSTDNVIVTVTGGTLIVEASADPQEICEGQATQLLALVGGGSGNYSFNWTSAPAGFSSDVGDPMAYPIVNTMYYIEISDGIDTAIDSVYVMVDPLPGSAASISGPAEVCAGMEEILYSIDAVSNASNYQWTLPEGFYGNSDENEITILIGPNITIGGEIIVTPVNSCGAGMPSTLFVEVINVPGIPETPIGPDSLCTTTNPSSVYTLSNPIPDATGSEWLLLPAEAGTLVVDGLSATLNWTENWEGQAGVSVRALNNCGYSDWSMPIAINAFNCLGIYEPDRPTLDLNIYPNPVSGLLYVDFVLVDVGNNLTLAIWDIYGRKMMESDIPAEQRKLQIQTDKFADGIYILTINNFDELLGRKKFIVNP